MHLCIVEYNRLNRAVDPELKFQAPALAQDI